ncbi:toxin [Bacillus sp. FJAT-50079]|uniref:anthrax toxin lethal factor-related metalloendopeptidase n=1 Tax=Bacillus sp. FJAT-50079 TaxID=2833577 RepID=UPI001BCA3CD0|nr:toxin [Bacillus sp. FJAT-50079]MBS4209833.1 toxin [Bacillus sp. FJAT-50079]
MKKWTLFPLLIMIVIVGTGLSRPIYDGVLLYKSPLFPQLHLQSEQLLKYMIVLPEGDFDEEEATNMIHRLDQLPQTILQELKNKNIKVVFFTGKLTDQRYTSYLKGVVPRGYPDSIVWDDVPGIGGSKLVHVKIGHSEYGNGHGSVNLEFHEVAHSLYRYVYRDPDMDAKLKDAWEKEAKSLFPEQKYFLDYEEEFFAESFAYYFLSNESRTKLKQNAPHMYALFAEIDE